jgi:hypothetical protein
MIDPDKKKVNDEQLEIISSKTNPVDFAGEILKFWEDGEDDHSCLYINVRDAELKKSYIFNHYPFTAIAVGG